MSGFVTLKSIISLTREYSCRTMVQCSHCALRNVYLVILFSTIRIAS